MAFNMMAFIPIGSKLERQLGTVKVQLCLQIDPALKSVQFLYLILLIILLADVFYILLAYLLATSYVEIRTGEI